MQVTSYLEFRKATIADKMPVKWGSPGDIPFSYKGCRFPVAAKAREVAGLGDVETLVCGFLLRDQEDFPKGALICTTVNGHLLPGSPCAISSEAWC